MAHLLTVSGSSENALTATATGIVVPATATYCTLSVGMRGADGTATTLSSATLGGQAFTLDNTNLRVFQTFQSSEGGYILAADMPSGTLTATATRGTATNGMTISVSFFDDVVQNAPIFNTGANAAGGDPFNTSVTMTATGVLVDTISTANGSASFTTNQTGQTQRSTDGPVGNIFSFSSTRAVSSGSQTMGWDTSSNTDRTTHLVMGLETAASGDTATVTESSLTDGGTISGTYTKTSEWTSSDPTEGTLDGIALTNFSASTGTWSADLPDVYSIAEGLTYPTTAAVPDFGTVDVVIGDGIYNAPAVSKVFNVKSGWAEVTLATVDTVTTEGLYLRINATVTPDRDIATTDKIYYDTVSGDVTVTDDGLYSLDGATNDFDFAVISATNNVDEAFQFSNLGGGGGTIGKSTTISISTGIFI